MNVKFLQIEGDSRIGRSNCSTKDAMEAKSTDPYEQQLYSVFESCLEKGHTKLTEAGLRNLCDKLQLEERGDLLIKSLLSSKTCSPFISFTDFRNGLVKLLDTSQNSESVTKQATSPLEKEQGHWSSVLETNQRLRQFCGKFNGNLITDSINSDSEKGPVLSKQLLQSFFEKVDMDSDGLINFEDSILLLQTIKNIQDSLNSDWIDRSTTNSSENSLRLKPEMMMMMGSEETGLIRRSSVINLWEIAGVTDAANLLSDLGFTSSATEISLTELATVLSDEIKSLQHEPINPSLQTHVNLLKGALVIYQEEVRSYNNIVEQLRAERDKLRGDVTEANERASLLAQEIDENHMKLEKSRQEQIKQLETKHMESIREIAQQNSVEREQLSNNIKKLTDQLANLQQEEQQQRGKLVSALNENQTLELENQNHLEQISKLKHSNNQLLLQVQMLAAEHDEAVQNDERENEQLLSLVERIKSLQAESALLRDQNDELTTELEALKNKNSEAKNRMLGYSDESHETSSSVADQAPELRTNGKQWGRTFSSSHSILKSNAELDRIIKELKLLLLPEGLVDGPSTCTNSDRQSRDEAASELLINLERLLETTIVETKGQERTNESLRDLVVNKNIEQSKLMKRISTSDGSIHSIDKSYNSMDTKIGKSRSLRDYPPREEEAGKNDGVAPPDNDTDIVTVLKQERDRLSALIKEQEIKHDNEKRVLQEQILELEKSLDSLKTEYYECEDYWVDKIEEERQLMEQEQKVSDEKLAELIAKIAEYEEQFSNSAGTDKCRNDGRLSPIEEKFNLEQQYADLQAEFEEFRGQSQNLLSEKDREIIELEEKVAKKEIERTDIAVQTIDEKCLRKVMNSSASPGISNHPFISADIALNNTMANSQKFNYYGVMNHQKLFEPGKLNQIAENSITRSDLSFPSRTISGRCYCQVIDYPYEGEIQRLHKKKADIDNECNSLMKQKNNLIKEIIELESYGKNSFSIDNLRKGLVSMLQSQQQKTKSLQTALRQQRICTEQLLEKVWRQHKTEIENIQAILKDTQQSLQKQIQLNSVNIERLGKADLIMKDLYVENAFLKKQIGREIAGHRQIISNRTTTDHSMSA
uniref:EF-hand domain-containing protein n=1 Tax=Bracon brevicornis TaxID=1563983 RepID=A0A6V7JX67_9HYME